MRFLILLALAVGFVAGAETKTRELPVELVGVWRHADTHKEFRETTRDYMVIPAYRSDPPTYWPEMTVRRDAAGALLEVEVPEVARGCLRLYKMTGKDTFALWDVYVDRQTGERLKDEPGLEGDFIVARR
jgi:hypothetical protein